MFKNLNGSLLFQRARLNLLFLFSFSIPLHQKWSTILLLILVPVSLMHPKDPNQYGKLSFFLPPILYLLIAGSLLYSDQVEFRYLEQRAALIAFPIVFSVTRLQGFELKKVFRFFILGCATALILCYFNAFCNSLSFANGELIFTPVLNEEFSFMYSVVRDGNYFFSSYFSIFHQTTYFALYLNSAIALILAFSLWKRNRGYLILLVFFSLAIFQLSSKLNLFLCAIIYIIYGILHFKNKFTKAIITFSFIAIGIFLLISNPRGKIMLDTLVNKGFSIDANERYGYGLRLMSWDAAKEVIKKNPILGVGIGDTQSEMNKVYLEKGYAKPLKESLNAHNQFLEVMLFGGIPGLVVLLGILVALSLKIVDINTELGLFNLMFLILILLSFFFESVMNRYSGISFFVFFYYLITSQNKESMLDHGS